MSEDPRRTGLKAGLRQLTAAQLRRVIDYPGEMFLDEVNYVDGKFCPLAVGLSLGEEIVEPTHEKVFARLTELGYVVYNTFGVTGSFYTTERARDLMAAAREVLSEKLAEAGSRSP